MEHKYSEEVHQYISTSIWFMVNGNQFSVLVLSFEFLSLTKASYSLLFTLYSFLLQKEEEGEEEAFTFFRVGFSVWLVWWALNWDENSFERITFSHLMAWLRWYQTGFDPIAFGISTFDSSALPFPIPKPIIDFTIALTKSLT